MGFSTLLSAPAALTAAAPADLATAAAVGSSALAARADHVHRGLTLVAPLDTAAAAALGAELYAARGDHVHRAVGSAAPLVVGSTAAAAGAALLAAREDHRHALDDTGWITPTFLNGWINYDAAAYSRAAYRKVGPLVTITGLVKSGTVGSDVFVLPAGYRPARNLHFSTPFSSGGAATHGVLEITVTVGTPGGVKCNVGGNTWFSLECTFAVA